MNLLERMFHLTERGTTVRRELLGALTSFFSVAYILFVTPSYLSQTGMDYTGVLLATCLSSALACFLSAAFDLPFMLAPGVGLNAFFTYTLCLTMGYTWAQALAVVSLSGVAFLIISLTPLRDQMISCIPPSMKNAISAGLGLFIALIGLLNSGIVRAEDGALLLGEIGAPATFLAILGLHHAAGLPSGGDPGAGIHEPFPGLSAPAAAVPGLRRGAVPGGAAPCHRGGHLYHVPVL